MSSQKFFCVSLLVHCWALNCSLLTEPRPCSALQCSIWIFLKISVSLGFARTVTQLNLANVSPLCWGDSLCTQNQNAAIVPVVLLVVHKLLLRKKPLFLS